MTTPLCPSCGGRLDPLGNGLAYLCRMCGEDWDAEDLLPPRLKETKMDYDLNLPGCEICGRYGQPLTLIGEYKTTLCDTHAREWYDLVWNHPLIVLLDTLEIKLQLVIAATAGGQYTDASALSVAVGLQRQIREAKDDLHIVARRWSVDARAQLQYTQPKNTTAP